MNTKILQPLLVNKFVYFLHLNGKPKTLKSQIKWLEKIIEQILYKKTAAKNKAS